MADRPTVKRRETYRNAREHLASLISMLLTGDWRIVGTMEWGCTTLTDGRKRYALRLEIEEREAMEGQTNDTVS